MGFIFHTGSPLSKYHGGNKEARLHRCCSCSMGLCQSQETQSLVNLYHLQANLPKLLPWRDIIRLDSKQIFPLLWREMLSLSSKALCHTNIPGKIIQNKRLLEDVLTGYAKMWDQWTIISQSELSHLWEWLKNFFLITIPPPQVLGQDVSECKSHTLLLEYEMILWKTVKF